MQDAHCHSLGCRKMAMQLSRRLRLPVNEKRAERLMRESGLLSVARRKKYSEEVCAARRVFVQDRAALTWGDALHQPRQPANAQSARSGFSTEGAIPRSGLGSSIRLKLRCGCTLSRPAVCGKNTAGRPAFRVRCKADFCVQPPFALLRAAAPCPRRMGMNLSAKAFAFLRKN